jgi:hypothetical protein
MKFKEDMEVVPSSEPYYDFFLGGYLEPENFLENEEDIEKVNEARNLIQEYLDTVIEEI